MGDRELPIDIVAGTIVEPPEAAFGRAEIRQVGYQVWLLAKRIEVIDKETAVARTEHKGRLDGLEIERRTVIRDLLEKAIETRLLEQKVESLTDVVKRQGDTITALAERLSVVEGSKHQLQGGVYTARVVAGAALAIFIAFAAAIINRLTAHW